MPSVEFIVFMLALVALSQLAMWQIGRALRKQSLESKRLAREIHEEAKRGADLRSGLNALLEDAQKYRDLILKTDTALEGMVAQYELRIRRAESANVAQSDFVDMG